MDAEREELSLPTSACAPLDSCTLVAARTAWLDQDHPIAAVLAGVLGRSRVRRTLPPLAPDERLDGKLALVTGGASGLDEGLVPRDRQAGAMRTRTAVHLHKMAPRDVDARAADASLGRALWEASESVLARARGQRWSPARS